MLIELGINMNKYAAMLYAANAGLTTIPKRGWPSASHVLTAE